MREKTHAHRNYVGSFILKSLYICKLHMNILKKYLIYYFFIKIKCLDDIPEEEKKRRLHIVNEIFKKNQLIKNEKEKGRYCLLKCYIYLKDF